MVWVCKVEGVGRRRGSVLAGATSSTGTAHPLVSEAGARPLTTNTFPTRNGDKWTATLEILKAFQHRALLD